MCREKEKGSLLISPAIMVENPNSNSTSNIPVGVH